MRLRSSKIIGLPKNEDKQSPDSDGMFIVVCVGYIWYITIVFSYFFEHNDISETSAPAVTDKLNLSDIFQDMI
jgi:hypothetical protein